ncbi:MAG: flagellar protein FlaG [Nitrospinales bacterium]|nr:flagellar protein FlaG [Nitrospinales bacterium]
MSVPIPFNPFEQRLNDQNVIKPKAIKNGSGELKPESLSKNENTLDEVQGSTAGEIESSLIHSLNRKVDYHIEENNEVVVKIRDGETGEIIRQIPEEEFLRLTNRISDFNKSILDQTV